MEEKIETNNKFDSLLEQLLIFAVTTCTAVLILYLFSKTIRQTANERIYVDGFSFFITIFSGLVYSFVLYIFVKEKTKIAFYICFIVFYVILEVFLCFLFGKLDLPYILIPLSIVHFFVEAILNDVFVAHDAFLNSWYGKKGHELETYLYHNNVEAGDLSESLKNYRTALTAICIFYFGFSVFVKISRNTFNLPMIINTIVFVFSVFMCFYKIGYFNREAYYANMGFEVLVHHKRDYFKSIIAIFIIAVALGGLFSKNEPLIKLHLKESAPVEVKEAKPPVYENKTMVEPTFDKEDLEEALGHSSSTIVIQIIFEIIKYAALGLLAFYLIFFLIRPFFSKGWKSFWAENKLYYYFRKFVEEVKAFIDFLFKRTNDNYATVEAKSFKTSIQNFIKSSSKSKEKKAELDRLTKQFMILIDWGSKKGILYKKNLAPAEYTSFFNNPDADIVGLLFEKALYDKVLLTNEEENQYILSIKKIISSQEN